MAAPNPKPTTETPVQRTGARADIADHSYARKIQALIKLMTDLRALGAQTDIDLPRITVIGNQSAGKSSLVEAMTKITVPRSPGTCTRCPMECRLSRTMEPFKCQIFIRIEKDELGNPVDKVKETKFGPVLHDKSDLEKMLRRAQLAVLNPSVPKEQFVGLDLESLRPGKPPLGSNNQLQFSANVVCVDISSPDVADLSFIDLPGIISNVAEGEDPESINLIKNLVRDNIKGNALILLTITMRDDIQNQSAALLAKEADPKGSRTIGVLTKPDTLQAGEHADWLDVLAGRKHPLTHGYYVTKQASAAELLSKSSYEEGREREQLFFTSESPWRDQDLNIRRRMGVPNLSMQLSILLSQLIEKTLPKLRQDSRSSLNVTLTELHELPPPPSDNPTTELLELLAAFTSHLQGRVRGSSGHEGLIQSVRPAYETFKWDILATRPNFVPQLRLEVTEDESSEDEEEPSSDAKTHNVTEEDSERNVAFLQEPVYLDDVRERVRRQTTRELPYNVPYQVKVYFIEQCLMMWKHHAYACFDKVCDAYQKCLFDLVKSHFEKYSNGGLYEQVRNIVEQEVDRVKSESRDRISWLLELEEDPFTLNEHYLSSCRDKYLVSFRKQRQGPSGQETKEHSELVQRTLKYLAAIGKPCREEDLSRFDGPDPYEQELLVMAEVMAYFRVAYKRIIDNLPRSIDIDFLKGLQKRMHSALITGLRLDEIDSRETAARLLSEDPTIASRRVVLKQVKERLEGICTKLNNFASLGM